MITAGLFHGNTADVDLCVPHLKILRKHGVVGIVDFLSSGPVAGTVKRIFLTALGRRMYAV